MTTRTFEFTTEDIEYLRHPDKALKLRLYVPRGSGPFPAVVDLHGGAWAKGSLEECKDRDQVLARSGLVVAALDFRDGNFGYPTALSDMPTTGTQAYTARVVGRIVNNAGGVTVVNRIGGTVTVTVNFSTGTVDVGLNLTQTTPGGATSAYANFTASGAIPAGQNQFTM